VLMCLLSTYTLYRINAKNNRPAGFNEVRMSLSRLPCCLPISHATHSLDIHHTRDISSFRTPYGI
jgi:hypothetical protein